MKKELQKLGLSENEATIYLSLLELGSTNAGEIIKKTKLHRNIVYDNLEKLIEKGLVTFVVIRGVKHFETTKPLELKEFVEKQKKIILEKEKIAEVLLPEIEKKRTVAERKSEAAIFKGKRGIQNLLEDMVNERKELLIFATGWGLKKIMGHYYHQWHMKLKENKILGRAILSRKMKTNERLPYQVRYLPERYVMPSTICIYGNNVATIVWEEPIAFLIKNKSAADSYRKYFDLLWKTAKP